MFACLLLGIIEDLFPDCKCEVTDISGAPEKLQEERPDVVIYGHDGDASGVDVLQGIKAKYPGMMTILEGASVVSDELILRVDYFWGFPYNHQELKKFVEDFFQGKELGE